MPGSGGSYRYLKEIYGPQKLGRAHFFSLHLAIVVQRATLDRLGRHRPLAICGFLLAASGARLVDAHCSLNLPLIGTLQFTWVAMPATLVAIGVCALTAFLLYRRITAISRFTNLLWLGVMATIGWIIFTGLTHFNAHQAFDLPPGRIFVLARLFSRTRRSHADRGL